MDGVQRQQSGREVSHPQSDYLFKDFPFLRSHSASTVIRLSFLQMVGLLLKKSVLRMSVSFAASPTRLIFMVSNIELGLSSGFSFRSRQKGSRGTFLRRGLRCRVLLSGLSGLSRSSSNLAHLSERKDLRRLLTTTGKLVVSGLCSGETFMCLLRANRMEQCVFLRLKKLCIFSCGSRVCLKQCSARPASIAQLYYIGLFMSVQQLQQTHKRPPHQVSIITSVKVRYREEWADQKQQKRAGLGEKASFLGWYLERMKSLAMMVVDSQYFSPRISAFSVWSRNLRILMFLTNCC